MDKFYKGWFTHKHCFAPGQAFSLEVEDVLHHEKSQYQDILVFQSKSHGRVLLVDYIVQFTEKDEFSYHEMITHIPLCSHPNPKNVLVVGGGDGGVVREVVKHPCVEEIHLCELDERMIDICKQYFPHVSSKFTDPRVQVHIEDGQQFMAQHKQMFDVIITDSSDTFDNDGPVDALFHEPYYENMKNALKPGGIICTQVGCVWLEMEDLAEDIIEFSQKLFPVVRYAYTFMPSYEDGTTGYILASLSSDTVFERPLRALSEAQMEDMGLKYYNSDMHRAAFVLPQFSKKVLFPTK